MEIIPFIPDITSVVAMACAELTVCEKSFLEQNIFQAIAQIRSNNKRPDLKSIHS